MTAFGSKFMPQMTSATFDGERWSDIELVSCDAVQLHAGAHVLHYASSVFEGLKAFKHADGSVKLFRPSMNIDRLIKSSELLSLPPVDATLLTKMITDVTAFYAAETPEPPGSMYIRPTHIGTDAAIGAAAVGSQCSMLYILVSPVGDYFAGGSSGLRILVEEDYARCAPHMGMIKSGSNYASALGPIIKAKQSYDAAQILFCPDGDVQETGASNFFLIDGNEIITKNLDSTFLHGVTRDSILTLARSRGMTVSERQLSTDELFERIKKPDCEAALSGTAAVLTPVTTLIRNGVDHSVGSGQEGKTTVSLREELNAIQWGQQEDTHDWLVSVS